MKTAYLLLRPQQWLQNFPQNLVSSLSRLFFTQKARVSSSVATATLLPAKTMLYWLCPSWGLISCICHVGSWNREAAEEKLCPPGSQLVPALPPEARPPYHSTQHRSGQCTSLGDLRAERSGAGQNAMKGFVSSAISQKNGYFRPDLTHIIHGSETRLLLCVQRWQLFALVIWTITLWSDATDEWLI